MSDWADDRALKIWDRYNCDDEGNCMDKAIRLQRSIAQALRDAEGKGVRVEPKGGEKYIYALLDECSGNYVGFYLTAPAAAQAMAERICAKNHDFDKWETQKFQFEIERIEVIT